MGYRSEKFQEIVNRQYPYSVPGVLRMAEHISCAVRGSGDDPSHLVYLYADALKDVLANWHPTTHKYCQRFDDAVKEVIEAAIEMYEFDEAYRMGMN